MCSWEQAVQTNFQRIAYRKACEWVDTLSESEIREIHNLIAVNTLHIPDSLLEETLYDYCLKNDVRQMKYNKILLGLNPEVPARDLDFEAKCAKYR